MKKKKDKGVTKAFSMITQMGINMLTPVLVALIIGYVLDRLLHTGFFTVILVVLGILAAFRNAYYVTRSFYADDLKREEEKLKYIEDLKNFRREHPENEGSGKGKDE